MQLILGLIINAFVVLVLSYVLPGVSVDSFVTAVIVVVALSIVNFFIKPLIKLLTLPLNLLTLGLFGFIINALFILLVDSLVGGFKVDNLLWAGIFSMVLSLVSGLLGSKVA